MNFSVADISKLGVKPFTSNELWLGLSGGE